MHSLEKLVPITTNYGRKAQTSDLRFYRSENDQGSGKFTPSETLIAELGLQNKGFQLHVAPDDKELFLTTHPHESENCVMFTKRADSDKKSSDFSSQKFALYLAAYGWIPDKGKAELDMNLEEVGELNGVTYYQVKPVLEEETTQETTQEITDIVSDAEETEVSQEIEEPVRAPIS